MKRRGRKEVFPLRKAFEGEDRSLLKIVNGRNFDFSPHSEASPCLDLEFKLAAWPETFDFFSADSSH
jgi:hypothetical protein